MATFGSRACTDGTSMPSDEMIAKLSLPEIMELMRRLLEEIELRAMRDAE